MDFQTLFNAAMGGVMMLSGWVLRAVWDAIKSLRNDLRELEREIPSVYVRRDEYREDLRDIKDMLRHISDKLDEKQDK
jgi:septal ring factor EnvC (AmiA/AmiB activator)